MIYDSPVQSANEKPNAHAMGFHNALFHQAIEINLSAGFPQVSQPSPGGQMPAGGGYYLSVSLCLDLVQ